GAAHVHLLVGEFRRRRGRRPDPFRRRHELRGRARAFPLAHALEPHVPPGALTVFPRPEASGPRRICAFPWLRERIPNEWIATGSDCGGSRWPSLFCSRRAEAPFWCCARAACTTRCAPASSALSAVP